MRPITRRWIQFVIVAALPILTLSCQKSQSDRIDDLFAEFTEPGSPGCAVAVVKNGAIVYKEGYGLANLEYGIPIRPSTLFNIGSVSKQFTAMAIVILAEQGKLTLDDDYREFLPEMPDYGDTITVRHLLNHTSGLRSYTSLMALAGWTDLEDVMRVDQVMDMVARQQRLDFPPGKGYRYSNTGYLLLAEMVARITGKTFGEWVKENLFDPLGMNSTIVLDDYRMIVSQRAYSYSPHEDTGYVKEVQNSSCVGQGGIYSTVEDLAKWILHLEKLRRDDSAIMDRMLQAGTLESGFEIEYAAGLYLGRYGEQEIIRHGGGSAGFNSELVWFPELEFSVCVLSNLSSTNPRQLSAGITDIYYPELMADSGTKPTGSSTTAISVDRGILERYAGVYKHSSGFKIRIALDEDGLVAHVPTWGPNRLSPETETRFAMPSDPGVKFLFQVEERSVTDLILRQPESDDIPLSREGDWEPSPEQLESYTGEFYSEELGTTYSLVVEDDRLIAKHLRNHDAILIPETEDVFSADKWWLRYVNFTRGEKGEITGLKMDGFRSTDLAFKKKAI